MTDFPTDAEREAIRDEIAGWPIGSGYYSTQIGIDEARDLTDRIIAAEIAPLIRAREAAAWDAGFSRGFYDVLAGGDRDASESAATNPYEATGGRRCPRLTPCRP